MTLRPPTNRRAQQDWHREDIKAAVRKTSYGTLTKLALAYGLPRHACYRACREPHYWGELAIAAALRMPPRDIWPSRYPDNVVRLVHDVPHSTALKSAPHRQIGRAA